LQKKCIEECLQSFKKLSRELVGEAREVAGAGKLLAELFGRIPLYVASVNPQEELDFLICQRGWQKWFAGWYGNPPYPKDQALAAIAAKEQIDCSQLLLIGDSSSDREAATKVGSQVWLRTKGALAGIWKDGTDLAEKLSKVLAEA
jgi:phosphoglycolate phosphatase-like HAD superfamily hydrolase